MTPDQELMSAAAKTIFRLNGQLLALAERLAVPAGLTAAWWQVLGAVLDQPLSVAEVARTVGVTRQSVQRVADLLVEHGLAEYRPNPAHRRAKLLRPTAKGRGAVDRIRPAHAELAARLAQELGHDRLREAVDALARLAKAFDALSDDPHDARTPPH